MIGISAFQNLKFLLSSKKKFLSALLQKNEKQKILSPEMQVKLAN
jgi:hypothetical protein